MEPNIKLDREQMEKLAAVLHASNYDHIHIMQGGTPQRKVVYVHPSGGRLVWSVQLNSWQILILDDRLISSVPL